jgi:translocation and assembly module TamA
VCNVVVARPFAFYWISQIDGFLDVIMKRSLLVAAAASVLCAPAIWAFDLSVSVEGGDDDLTKSVRAATILRDLRNRDENSAQDILGAARADYARVVSALYENGFYGAEVSIKLDGAEATSIPAAVALPQISEVKIIVNPGPSFLFGQVDISPIAPKTEALIGFETGALASLSSIRTATEQTTEGWRARGHAKADVARQSITARHSEAVLDVAIVINKGPYLTFGDLSLSGASAVRAERIRAIAGLPTGTGFDPIEVELVTTRLRRAGAFDTIALVEADNANADDSLEFALQVNDRAPRQFGFGAELSSQAGAELSTFWLHRNLFGGAERLRLGRACFGHWRYSQRRGLCAER